MLNEPDSNEKINNHAEQAAYLSEVMERFDMSG